MNIDYYIVDPTGNITALVETHVSENNRTRIADTIMALHPEVEQVGFIKDENGYFLNMAGGEFCGNATLSAAAIFCRNLCADNTGAHKITIDVSGADEPVCVEIKRDCDNLFFGKVKMPCAKEINSCNFYANDIKYNLSFVDFGGITHIICEDKISRADAENLIKEWAESLNTPCLGIMFTDFESKTLTPLVYSRNADTLFWENSCASGTTAAGVYYAHIRKENVNLTFSEPGGQLSISAGEKSAPILSGKAQIKGRYTINIQ